LEWGQCRTAKIEDALYSMAQEFGVVVVEGKNQPEPWEDVGE
jgi:hypothetical protein